MRRTLVDRLAERVHGLDGDLVTTVAVDCLAPVEPYACQPQPEPPVCGVPIIAGELVLPDWDLLLGSGR